MNKLRPTPAQVEGPYYPVGFHPQEGSDLTQRFNNSNQSGVQQLLIQGQVLNTDNIPMKHVNIEIWQADQHGRYNHPNDIQPGESRDPSFLYWGRTLTDENGFYTFKTIKPAAYNDDGDWRCPHIHFKVFINRKEPALTTQLYFENEPLNETDNHFSALDDAGKKMLLVNPSSVREDESILHARFNIVLEGE